MSKLGTTPVFAHFVAALYLLLLGQDGCSVRVEINLAKDLPAVSNFDTSGRTAMSDVSTGFIPGQFGIDAYGSGGFKFAGMSHRGSILVLPTGVHAWPIERPDEIDAASLAPLLVLPKSVVDLLLVGTGTDLIPLPAALRARLREAGIRSDPMATGAAARTYNVLLGEGRRVAAALLAVA